MNGAEQLLGKGDLLFLPTGSPKPTRIQNAFISTEEVERITDYIASQPGYSKPYFLPSLYDKKKDSGAGFLSDMDPMFEDAARVIVRHQQGSVSLLQRRLKLGYSRAARIVDQLEEAGIVGPNDGSKARTVIVENEEQLETILRSL
jgi:S-DNA-T family DNA segregation ATPase FtsK/SpoIIIE